MDRAFLSGASGSAPAAPSSPSIGFPQSGNPALGTPATKPGPYWYHMMNEEMREVILSAGLTPNQNNLTQLRDAIARRTHSFVAGYTAGAYSLTPEQAGLHSLDAYAGNITINLPQSNAITGNVSQFFHFVRRDASSNSVTINCAGSDLLDDAAASFTLEGFGRSRTVMSSGTLLRWFTVSRSEDASGEVFYTTSSTAPAGSIKANGTLLSRSVYRALFQHATAQGLVSEATWTASSSGRYSVGDGSTTFRIPDLRGEFLRGFDDGRGMDSGRGIGTFQDHQFQNHTHISANTPQNIADADRGGLSSNFSIDTDSFPSTGLANSGNRGSETRPRNIALLACIKF